MGILISYDISSEYKIVKQELKKKGYKDQFISDNTVYYLPNKTLWHDKETLTPKKALKDLHDIIQMQNLTTSPKIEVIRVFAVSFPLSSWAAIQGTQPTL
ncbi:hypothetical protein [Xanthocytophaga agilis]|uniref:Uncharacterized protein n=1 Tax=Xanthocytophaga agilis TaxID=3048010 RepID=A0AAE3R3Q7_9BACT|nr:hypothetical protein [Xanthocytophaga agilis]MDJ1503174.1 hypothetical protein [Xanthocytophaga agilis]